MKLLDPDPLRAQCRDEITGIVRYANQPGHAVRGTDRRGNEIVAVASRYHPFDLEGSLDLQPPPAAFSTSRCSTSRLQQSCGSPSCR